ncbi:MAG: branched-chain amino acid ABC transporter permease [Actinobacteria bacterium]|nr:branched-chain amino acid ABC transporter permease [Actinomycetota bacterium]
MVLGAFFSLMAVGLTLIFGVLRVVNFTHGVMFMLGAYATWYLNKQGAPYLVAVALGGLSVGLFGVLLEIVVLRRFRGLLIEGAVVAIALAILLQNLALQVIPLSPQSVPTPFEGTAHLGGVYIAWQRIFIVVVAVVLIAGLSLFIKRSRFGRSVRALQQNPQAAELQGIRPDLVAPLVFGVGATLAGLAGGLIVPVQQLLPTIGEGPLLDSFVVVVLGGLGSVEGTLIAAMLIGLAQSATTTYWTEPASIAVSFLIAIAVLVVRPQGLLGNE